jgi:integrase
MASIRKRRNKFFVVYYYTNENGEQKQKWESYDTEYEAKTRKAEIEYKQQTKRFIAPSKLTVSDFLDDFVSLYGVKRWGPSSYEANTALIRNYIKPLIGDTLIQDMTAIAADRFISQLQKTKCVTWANRYSKREYMTPANIERINRLLKCAFKQAIRWNVVERNPFECTTLPKVKSEPRAIWDAETIRKALDACKDARLYVAINLSFACSLRIGEVLGLTWDNIHISDADIARDDAYLMVEKELARVRESTIRVLGDGEIIKVFPRTMYTEDASTLIVLKTPKTESSIRKVWMPKTVAYILREWKASQDHQKEFLGDEYIDHNLVVALPNGRPCEDKVITNAFNRLKRDAELPNVVFHSLRHSSTTYKLKLNHGDLKATQGDTGHAQVDMITKIYAHILDEDRKVNAQRFEAAFYANPDLRSVHAPVEEQQSVTIDAQALLDQLQQSPELLAALSALMEHQFR